MRTIVTIVYSILIISSAPISVSPANAAAADVSTTLTPITLAALEAEGPKDKTGQAGILFTVKRTQRAIELAESNTLKTANDFFRAAKLVQASHERYRTDRVRYELLLVASALGESEAEKQLAGAWDGLLASLGRPLRTDFAGLVQQQPDYYQLDLAPGVVQAVLRDPEKARGGAKSAERNPELKKIVDEDQADRRRDWSKLTPEEMKATGERDQSRNTRTLEILKAGELHTAADFANASLVMQHSALFTGFQSAHELAVCAMLLGDRSLGRWLVAATYDRMLNSIGHDQRFGTQYSGMGGTTVLARTDVAGICDNERTALGCPTLEEAQSRKFGGEESTGNKKLVAEFSGPNRAIRDPKFGLTATYPDGWHIREVLRWGDQQNTIFFDAAAAPDAQPSLYYQIFREPRPITAEALPAWFQTEALKKAESRRENGYPNYANRPASLTPRTVGGNPAFSWIADFVSSEGEKSVEYFVCIRTDTANALFFLQAPAGQIKSLIPQVDRLMEGLGMPELQTSK